MEKDTGRYRYEPYPQLTKQNNGNTNSLKRDATKKEQEVRTGCCKCFGKKKSRRNNFLHGCITNLGICLLLFVYTLIGSFIFLAIEGGNNVEQQILATTSNQHYKKPTKFNTSIELNQINAEARARTVENIWNMTESLNILYKDNWTRLAAQEITRFQDQIIKRLTEQINSQIQPAKQEKSVAIVRPEYEWNFAKAFLYSLTVLTTIGYGSIAPRSTLGKAVTMGYAVLGIPLTLLYLSSVGSLLSHVARGVFSRALCCCLCSNCGYCCYDEKRMAEKERRMKKKRQQLELQQQLALQEPFYVRSNSAYTTSSTTGTTHNNLHSPVRDIKETDSLSCTDNESKTSMHGLSILAPILLCLIIMFCYICIGAFVLYKLENWSLLDGFYFCFMSLTTVGFGDMVPGSHTMRLGDENSGTLWFCSLYIMSGMALTAMCFNVVHDEIIHRLKHQNVGNVKKANSASFTDDLVTDPYNMAS